ncbi:MAG: anthranilate synthase component I family protein [Candidatus Cloacimonetes bacterium]|nr:anthranilate synthase component I family protein [Candidatus Cloacimonadota bacterium]
MIIKSYKIEKYPWVEAIDCFQQYSDNKYSLLLTGQGESDIAGFSLIAYNPVAVYSFHPLGSTMLQNDKTIPMEFTPWVTLRLLISTLNYESLPYPANRCGVTGFLSYEMAHTVEKLPGSTKLNYKLPHAYYCIYSGFIYFDVQSKSAFKIEISYDSKPLEQEFEKIPDSYIIGSIYPDFSKEEYCTKVQQIRDYVLDGEVYEVNLSQQYRAGFNGNPFTLFKNLYRKNPAPFSAFINLPNVKILSISPEQFIKGDGLQVETRPIKGTAPRYMDQEQDLLSRNGLVDSEKDKAELHMIVDLMRNDFSRSCKVGSVKVVTPHRLEKYTNVWHLVAIVEGVLEDDKDYIDLLKACFPGGSITGCPKVRSMEIIDELETSRRNLYTGSIFLMNQQFMQSSIVIRTGIITTNIDTNEQTLFFNSGGAVTIDSEPEKEYDETIHKVTHFIASGTKEYR